MWTLKNDYLQHSAKAGQNESPFESPYTYKNNVKTNNPHLTLKKQKISNPNGKKTVYIKDILTLKKSNNLIYGTSNLLVFLLLIGVVYNPHPKKNSLCCILMWKKVL